MKKIIKTLLIGAILIAGTNLFAASKKSIVCTTFPEYDWILNIVGNKVSTFEITLLQKNGTDLHSYQPSVKDIAEIAGADLFVYVGGESDEWVEKVLENNKKTDKKIINMLEALGDKVREEEIVEGMQAEEEEEESEEIEYDEHVWLSLNNAIQLTEVLADAIQEIDSANAAVYKNNAENYIKQLKKLDAEYAKAAANAKNKTLLFGDRFPFRYLVDDYGLKYYAAFVGCSAETEASFETIRFLADKVDELNLNAVLIIEKSDKKIARTIISNSKAKNQQILEMDSLQSITIKEIKKGRTYLSAMQNNLEVLKNALN